jgi:hypothetical protein
LRFGAPHPPGSRLQLARATPPDEFADRTANRRIVESVAVAERRSS